MKKKTKADSTTLLNQNHQKKIVDFSDITKENWIQIVDLPIDQRIFDINRIYNRLDRTVLEKILKEFDADIQKIEKEIYHQRDSFESQLNNKVHFLEHNYIDYLLFSIQNDIDPSIIRFLISNFSFLSVWSKNQIIKVCLKIPNRLRNFALDLIDNCLERWQKDATEGLDIIATGYHPDFLIFLGYFGTFQQFWRFVNLADWTNSDFITTFYQSLGKIWQRFNFDPELQKNIIETLQNNFQDFPDLAHRKAILSIIPKCATLSLCVALAPSITPDLYFDFLIAISECSIIQDLNDDFAYYIRGFLNPNEFPLELIQLAIRCLKKVRHPNNFPSLYQLYLDENSVDPTHQEIPKELGVLNECLKSIDIYYDEPVSISIKQFYIDQIRSTKNEQIQTTLLEIMSHHLDPQFESIIESYLSSPHLRIVQMTSQILSKIDDRFSKMSWDQIYLYLAKQGDETILPNCIAFFEHIRHKKHTQSEQINLIQCICILQNEKFILSFLKDQLIFATGIVLREIIVILDKMDDVFLKNSAFEIVKSRNELDPEDFELIVNTVIAFNERYKGYKSIFEELNTSIKDLSIASLVEQEALKRPSLNTLNTLTKVFESNLNKNIKYWAEHNKKFPDPLSFSIEEEKYDPNFIEPSENDFEPKTDEPPILKKTAKDIAKMRKTQFKYTVNAFNFLRSNIEFSYKHQIACDKVFTYLRTIPNNLECKANIREILSYITENNTQSPRYSNLVREFGIKLLIKIEDVDPYWGVQLRYESDNPNQNLSVLITQYLDFLRNIIRKSIIPKDILRAFDTLKRFYAENIRNPDYLDLLKEFIQLFKESSDASIRQIVREANEIINPEEDLRPLATLPKDVPDL